MSEAPTAVTRDQCVRDEHGFCLLAFWGNPKCHKERAGILACRGTDLETAYRSLIADAKRRAHTTARDEGLRGGAGDNA